MQEQDRLGLRPRVGEIVDHVVHVEIGELERRHQATGNSRPVSEDCLMVSRKRCRSTAVSNVGNRLCGWPLRTVSAKSEYICPTLNGSPRGNSRGSHM